MSSVPPSPPGDDTVGTEPPDDEVLAGELVLGVLERDARTQAQARSETDPVFAARVARWELRFAPWLAEIAPAAAPALLWDQICRRLGWRIEPAPRAGLWQSLILWRTVAAVAALAAMMLWWTRGPGPIVPPSSSVPPGAAEPAAKPVSTLARGDGSTAWLASVDPARGTVLMVPVPGPADALGRVPELWIIPSGQQPRSLGAVSINKSHTVAVPAGARDALVPGSVLAITLEPASGLPHAAPSGPVIAKGPVTI
ncbi:MAG: anti-sigma factor [Proteobacteria bacterium]|nr:anti-sigma factor [Pseudomonadota bacterium]